MRGLIRISGLAGLILAAALGLVAGCWPFTEGADCATAFVGCPPMDAGTDGNNADCSGDPSEKNVVEACGVFAQAGAATGGDGTQARPYATLGDALTAAESAGKRVYACAPAAMTFNEAVTISAGIEVYGGFDCTSWTWSPSARTALMGPADQVALTIENGAEGAKVEGLAITAASPSSMTMGGASIAVVVDDVAATLEQCDVKASDAADGMDGATPSGTATKGADAAAPDRRDGGDDSLLPARSVARPARRHATTA